MNNVLNDLKEKEIMTPMSEESTQFIIKTDE
jgi:hypothetical protein